MSLAKLVVKPRVLRTYDPDASAYISAVEAADGQSLEQPVRDAINTLVINCKIQGIWNAIQSSCLLAGPRTQAGAIIPLKGNAPILTSFSGDYNRQTGLQRISGTFNINRNNDVDAQNNKHVAVYISRIDYGTGGFNTAIGTSTATGGMVIMFTTTGLTMRMNSASNVFNNDLGYSNQLIGISISGTNTQSLYKNIISNRNDLTIVSPSGSATTHLYFASGTTASTSRIAFYSMGQSLNLQILNTIINQYLNSINQYLDSSYTMTDSDAISYVNNVTSINNVKSMGYIYRKSINDFVIGCKSDNIWTSLKASCILCGSPSLAGALYPLVGLAPTNYGFVDGNYNSGLGLSNTGRVNYLASNRYSNDDPQDSHHMSAFISTPESGAAEQQYMGCGTNNTGATHISTNTNRRSRSGTSGTSTTVSNNTLVGISRSNSNSFTMRTNGANIIANISSQTPTSDNMAVFSRHDSNGKTDATISFYSIGTAIDLSLLDTRVTTLVNQLFSARTI